jgi:nitrile hydratase beta subunit
MIAVPDSDPESEQAKPDQPPMLPLVNGCYDIGGAAELGPVPVDDDGAVFREPWEGLVMGMSLGGVASGAFTRDQHRAAGGAIHPALYLAASHYEWWMYSLETILVRAGLVSRNEIESRVAEVTENPDLPLPDNDNAELTERIKMVIAHGIPGWELDTEPIFAAGDTVRAKVVRVEHWTGTTRMPAFVQGREGVIEAVLWPEPLSNPVDAGGDQPVEHLYAVRFQASDLWPDANPNDTIRIQLWESHLEPAGGASAAEPREEKK